MTLNSSFLPTYSENKNRTIGQMKDYDLLAIYVTCEVISCVILVSTIYILISLVIFGNKTGRWKSSGRRSDVNRGTVYKAAVVTISLTIPRYIVNQVVFNVAKIPNRLQNCEIILDVGNVCYFTSMTAVYIFLWLRQKTLYRHPAMKRLAGKYVNIFSWTTLLVLSGAGLAILLWFIIPNDYTYTKNGCIVTPAMNTSTSDDLSYSVDYIVLVLLLLIAQVSLLGLFVYPMIRNSAIQSKTLRRSSRHNNVYVFKTDRNSVIDTTKGSNPIVAFVRQVSRKSPCAQRTLRRKCTIEKTIRRTIICASISMVSDIVTMVVAAVAIPKDLPRSLHNIVYDIGILISVICIFATFRGCLKVFLGPCNGYSYKKSDVSVTGDSDTGQGNVRSESASARLEDTPTP